MNVSDYLYVRSTHELLYQIFASEIGLASVSSPSTMQLAMCSVMAPLRQALMRPEAETFEINFERGDYVSLGKVIVSRAQDAQLFMELYRDFNLYPDESFLLSTHVFPLIGRMLQRSPDMFRFVADQLEYHMRKFGPAVSKRILDALPAFCLRNLASELERRLADLEAS